MCLGAGAGAGTNQVGPGGDRVQEPGPHPSIHTESGEEEKSIIFDFNFN